MEITEGNGMTRIQVMEVKILEACVRELLEQGFSLSVDNGGDELELADSKDFNAITAAMRLTDQDLLLVHYNDGKTGWLRFIYGEGGWDVIQDYTCSLDPFITKTNALVVALEEEDYHNQYGPVQ